MNFHFINSSHAAFPGRSMYFRLKTKAVIRGLANFKEYFRRVSTNDNTYNEWGTLGHPHIYLWSNWSHLSSLADIGLTANF